MYNYDTVSEAVNDLYKRGYIANFTACTEGIECNELHLKFSPPNFKIIETYRFEGNSDPADEAIVYAVESQNGIKGVLVNGYGISSDPNTDVLIVKSTIGSPTLQKGKMHVYDTISEAVDDLTKRGYTHNFKECQGGIECSALNIRLSPDKYKIKEIYRFEGFTDPADQAVVYAVESSDGIKGTVVNGYGIYSDSTADAIVSQL
jgi:hypothetical protein